VSGLRLASLLWVIEEAASRETVGLFGIGTVGLLGIGQDGW